MSAPTFWDERERAQKMVGELATLKGVLEPFSDLESEMADLDATVELVQEDGSASELLPEAGGTVARFSRHLDRLEVVSFLNGRFDRNDAIITLSAGQGGTEACDWAQILMRMYTRWMERKGFTFAVTDITQDDHVGIKSATLMVKGEYAFGYLKAEHGVHRLVRISPYDANKRRHTSFAALLVIPQVTDDVDVAVEEKDLRVDTFRSSGAGGQHVNTTDSAIRITHIPSGIVVSCQTERSQHQNRATAMGILRSKLYERQQAEVEKARESETGAQEENAWGSQIRSYVLHPYQMVKDLRTDYETSDTQGVLDGDLDPFIEAFLQSKERRAKRR
jgi:peptide chain release factor 2